MTYNSWFAALSKRSFLRFVLIYEIIPRAFFYQVTGQRIFDADTLEKFLGSDSWDEKTVIIELNHEFESKAFLPLIAIKKVWFNSLETQESFLGRGYENFNLESLVTGVYERSNNDFSIDIKLADDIDRADFRHNMAWQDGVTAIIHHQLLAGASLTSLIGAYKNERDLLLGLLGINSSEGFDNVLGEQFASLCVANGVEDGWDMNAIIDQLYENVKVVESSFDDLDKWIRALKKILNGDLDKPLSFSDDKNIVFRAITLTLFNPEIKAIEAFAAVKSNRVGESVKALAINFSLLRTGYSLFSDEQRQAAGAGRIAIQNIRAHLLNNDLQLLKNIETEQSCLSKHAQQALIDQATTEHNPELIEQSELFPAESELSEGIPSWLNEVKFQGNYKAYEIKGLDAKANFYPLLLVDEVTCFLGLQLLDLDDEKSAKKANTKFAVTALNLQKCLPAGSRFEITKSVFCLALPFAWWDSSELKTELSLVLIQLVPLDIFKKNKDKISG